MKKTALLFAFILGFSGSGLAYDFSVVVPSGQTLYFEYYGGGVKVVGGANLVGSMVIPDSVVHGGNKYAVVFIGGTAFSNSQGLTSVTIPNGVARIGDAAFALCYNLNSVTIPNSVDTIGMFAFDYCGLTSLAIDMVTYIGERAFDLCHELTTVTINSVTNLGQGAFEDCDVLASVTINNVSNMGNGIFSGCHSLTSVTILNGINVIPNYSFYGCYAMESISIPNTVNSVGTNAFYSCNKIMTVSIGNNTLSVSSNDTLLGEAHITFPYSTTWNHSLYANAYWTTTDREHYYFEWSNGDTNLVDTIILSSDSSMTALFIGNNYTSSVNVNDTSLGYVVFPDGNVARYLDTLMVVAYPIAHHHVAGWQGVLRVSANNDTAWVRMTGDITVSCTFTIDTYYVNVVADDTIRGSVSGGGAFVYGTPCTVEANAHAGYMFRRWSDGETANPYTFVPVENITLTAFFDETYTVSVSSNDPAMGSATVNGAAETTVISGDSVVLVATANAGYRFTHWSDDNTDATRIIVVATDTSFVAYFEVGGDTTGVGEVIEDNIRIYSYNGSIFVEGSQNETKWVFDMMGRMIENSKDATINVPASGVYIVKIGDLPARKVVVVK